MWAEGGQGWTVAKKKPDLSFLFLCVPETILLPQMRAHEKDQDGTSEVRQASISARTPSWTRSPRDYLANYKMWKKSKQN